MQTQTHAIMCKSAACRVCVKSTHHWRPTWRRSNTASAELLALWCAWMFSQCTAVYPYSLLRLAAVQGR